VKKMTIGFFSCCARARNSLHAASAAAGSWTPMERAPIANDQSDNSRARPARMSE
jgi:hypothetical protein